MKTIISVLFFVVSILSLVGFLSFMTDGFLNFEVADLAEKAEDIFENCKGWFQ